MNILLLEDIVDIVEGIFYQLFGYIAGLIYNTIIFVYDLLTYIARAKVLDKIFV